MVYKMDFIEFLISAGALRFGDFTLKSGRRSPYFINAGAFDTGEKLARLGSFYAARIHDAIDAGDIPEPDTIFGPAYKGIPLAAAAAGALARDFGVDTGYTFNRKEAKDHGEGGSFVGRQLKDGDRIVIVDDVITAGTAVREIVPLIRAEADVTICGLILSVDRMERGRGALPGEAAPGNSPGGNSGGAAPGKSPGGNSGEAAPGKSPGGLSAVEEVRRELGIPVFPIVTVKDILEAAPDIVTDGRPAIDAETKDRMARYMAEYC
ncbi:MAG: orotate phosphoribosyltransferase [Clostridiales Family XIII bacterium]|jgi:orotate phosphoribosyltransferase|nr:orotate phosphoribosyltransferase [Clostridiales Family XIII bacterium]